MDLLIFILRLRILFFFVDRPIMTLNRPLLTDDYAAIFVGHRPELASLVMKWLLSNLDLTGDSL